MRIKTLCRIRAGLPEPERWEMRPRHLTGAARLNTGAISVEALVMEAGIDTIRIDVDIATRTATLTAPGRVGAFVLLTEVVFGPVERAHVWTPMLAQAVVDYVHGRPVEGVPVRSAPVGALAQARVRCECSCGAHVDLRLDEVLTAPRVAVCACGARRTVRLAVAVDVQPAQSAVAVLGT